MFTLEAITPRTEEWDHSDGSPPTAISQAKKAHTNTVADAQHCPRSSPSPLHEKYRQHFEHVLCKFLMASECESIFWKGVMGLWNHGPLGPKCSPWPPMALKPRTEPFVSLLPVVLEVDPEHLHPWACGHDSCFGLTAETEEGKEPHFKRRFTSVVSFPHQSLGENFELCLGLQTASQPVLALDQACEWH